MNLILKHFTLFLARRIHIVILLALFLSGCTHYYYVPNTHNVPMLREKGETRVSTILGVSPDAEGLQDGSYAISGEVQSAFAAGNNLGIMVNLIAAKDLENDYHNWGRGSYLEAGPGYFKPLGRSWAFEFYGGAGLGMQSHQYCAEYLDPRGFVQRDNENAGTSSLSLLNIFIQPSLGYSSRLIDVAYSLKISGLSFFDINNQVSRSLNTYEFDKLEKLRHSTYLRLNKGFTLRIGWKGLKLQFQAVLESPYSVGKELFSPGHLSVGLTWIFLPIHKVIMNTPAITR